jgi:[pyruvate, water dikinase]-phosphate phosphotransferase / [pyruvate, water dikinase] kinase
VLVGVSRTGKTPISLYLSVLGWKVANIPLVPEIPTPSGLYELDRRRVIGLTIEPGQLLLHRQHRQRQLGVAGASAYIDPAQIHEEIQQSRKLFRQEGFSIINVTDKPIETCTDEIIRAIARQTGNG